MFECGRKPPLGCTVAGSSVTGAVIGGVEKVLTDCLVVGLKLWARSAPLGDGTFAVVALAATKWLCAAVWPTVSVTVSDPVLSRND